MKKLPNLALVLVALAVFADLGVAQQKGEEKKGQLGGTVKSVNEAGRSKT